MAPGDLYIESVAGNCQDLSQDGVECMPYLLWLRASILPFLEITIIKPGNDLGNQRQMMFGRDWTWPFINMTIRLEPWHYMWDLLAKMHRSTIDKEHGHTDHTASCFGININHIVIQLDLSAILNSA